jgi:Spy/CpxP family protein refolding chaperone
VVSTEHQSKPDAQFSDDFAGLTLTDEQKAAIEKIHQDAQSFKSQIVNDEKLNDDQKSAMLVGYARIEYGRKLTVLTPEQQKTVHQRVNARRAAEQAQHKSPPPQR